MAMAVELNVAREEGIPAENDDGGRNAKKRAARCSRKHAPEAPNILRCMPLCA